MGSTAATSMLQSAIPPRVHYATTDDGVNIAFTSVGNGPPLVYLQPHSHVHREWELPETRDWYTRVARHHRLLRLDIRRFGLSERDAGPITIETCITDVEAVVKKLGLERFALLGASGLSAVAAVYAARHPEQVERLVMWGPAAAQAAWRADGRGGERLDATTALFDIAPALSLELHARFMFGDDPPPRPDQIAFHRAAMRLEDLAAYDSCLREMAIWEDLPRVRAPTLAVFARRSAYMPLEHAKLIAAAIPDCDFVEADAEKYPFIGPDLDRNLEIVEAFLAPEVLAQREVTRPTVTTPTSVDLTPREREVLALIASGRSNEDVAAELGVSVSTSRRHVANLYAKMGVHNRAEATLWAVANGVVNPPSAT